MCRSVAAKCTSRNYVVIKLNYLIKDELKMTWYNETKAAVRDSLPSDETLRKNTCRLGPKKRTDDLQMPLMT